MYVTVVSLSRQHDTCTNRKLVVRSRGQVAETDVHTEMPTAPTVVPQVTFRGDDGLETLNYVMKICTFLTKKYKNAFLYLNGTNMV